MCIRDRAGAPRRRGAVGRRRARENARRRAWPIAAHRMVPGAAAAVGAEERTPCGPIWHSCQKMTALQ
eukprot:836136-Prymnesium_polylepis.1